MSKWSNVVRDKVEAYVVNTMQEERKIELLDNLSIAVEKIQNEVDRSPVSAVSGGECLKNLCDSLSDILHHGLKEKLGSGAKSKTSFWLVIEKLSVKDDIQTIYRLPIVQSDTNRCLLWIRMTLKEHTVGSYLTMLLDDSKLLREFYQYFAFMRDPVKAESVKTLFQYVISTMDFDIEIENLDDGCKESCSTPDSLSSITATRESTPSPHLTNATRRKGKKKMKSSSSKIAHIKDEACTPDHGSGRSSLSSHSSSRLSQVNCTAGNLTPAIDYSKKHHLPETAKRDLNAEQITSNENNIKTDLNHKSGEILEKDVMVIQQIKTAKSVSPPNTVPDVTDANTRVIVAGPQQVLCSSNSAFRPYKESKELAAANELNLSCENTVANAVDKKKCFANVDQVVKDTCSVCTTVNTVGEKDRIQTFDDGGFDSTSQGLDNYDSNEQLKSRENTHLSCTTGVNSTEKHSAINNSVTYDQYSETVPAKTNVLEIDDSRQKVYGGNSADTGQHICQRNKENLAFNVMSGESVLAHTEFTLAHTEDASQLLDSSPVVSNKDGIDGNFHTQLENSTISPHVQPEPVNINSQTQLKDISNSSSTVSAPTDNSRLYLDEQSVHETAHIEVGTSIKRQGACLNSPKCDSPSYGMPETRKVTATYDYFSENCTQSTPEAHVGSGSPGIWDQECELFTQSKQKCSNIAGHITSGISPVTGIFTTNSDSQETKGFFGSEQGRRSISLDSKDYKSPKRRDDKPEPISRSLARSITMGNTHVYADGEERMRKPGSFTARSLENHLFGVLKRYSSMDSQRSTFDNSQALFYDSGHYTTDSDSDSLSTENPEKQERERVRNILADLGISDDILGLKEDHFATPEAFMGFSSKEELEHAVDSCKQLIKNLDENSHDRTELIERLIFLRLKLQKEKETANIADTHNRRILGHLFQKKVKDSSNHFCDCCGSAIWSLFQTTYQCADCSYWCHKKCISLVDKQCVSQKCSDTLYITEICPEKGLGSQQYRCSDCRRRLICRDGQFDCRLCDYTGQMYCHNCHWNEVVEIPARIIHNWDFAPRKVSRQSKHLLNLMIRKPIICIKDLNPALFNFVEELRDIRLLREQILIMKSYLSSCRMASEKRMLLMLKLRQHFVESADIYSLRDLIDISSGWLLEELSRINAIFAQHIKFECVLCQGKAFFCEICKSQEAIFPFEYTSVRCNACMTTFHRNCFIKGNCPKCKRLAERRETNADPQMVTS